VIPVAASLRRHGASRGATTAFLLSTPQTGVDSILVTFSILGPVFAVTRPVIALVSGLLGGAVVDATESAPGSGGALPVRCEGECCSPGASDGKLRRALKYGLFTLPRDIGRALVVGILIAGLLSAVVPEDFFADYLGGTAFGQQVVAMLVMMLLGLPVYVCATASVPVAAALIHAGVSPGAALVFLMTGPATNAAAVATVWKVMGGRTALTYLATVALTAFAAGLLLNYVDPVGASTAHAGHAMLSPRVGTAAAVALAGVLAFALLAPAVGRMLGGAEAVQLDGRGAVTTLAIKGMTCGHCVENVRRALAAAGGVRELSVELGRAVVAGDVDGAELRRRVEEAGYEVTGVEAGEGSGKGE
jgi:uncharacterized membrane protein YraQ (UPF0718 family)/copper chaperone CopZ